MNNELIITDISDDDIKHATKVTDKYIDKLIKLTESHQVIREIQQNQEGILFVHTMMIGQPFKISLAVFVIYKECTYIFLCDRNTDYVVDHTSLSSKGDIIFSNELLGADGYFILIPDILKD